MRRIPWLVCLAFAGCQSFGAGDVVAPIATVHSLGRLVPKSLRLTEDPLLPQASLALERGDRALACELLRVYVERHPESKQTRVFYAEVLAKLGRPVEATFEFEKAIAALQEDKTLDLAMIVHSHGRLLDLADVDGDDYHVHLHRGLGLYWLAQQKRPADDSDEAIPTESILFKAVRELTQAHALVADEARASWYLHLSWRQLGQTAPAQRWLRTARATSVVSYLTPREQHELQLASQPVR